MEPDAAFAQGRGLSASRHEAGGCMEAGKGQRCRPWQAVGLLQYLSTEQELWQGQQICPCIWHSGNETLLLPRLLSGKPEYALEQGDGAAVP